MQAMTVVSIQNLKGVKLGDLTTFKSQSATYIPSGNKICITGNKWFQGFQTWLDLSFQ